MPIVYTEIARPTVSTYTENGKPMNRLLINATDFLLINASGDRLAISSTGYDSYTAIGKPSAPTYTGIIKPS